MGKKSEDKNTKSLLQEALINEEEQPHEIPKNWLWVRIGKIANVIGGGTPKTTEKKYFENGDVAWITPADLSKYDRIYISRGERNITRLGLENSSARLLKKNSVLLSSRAPIGYVAIAENELCTNQGFKSFEPTEAFISHYCYWYLKASKDLVESMASGTTFKEISGSKTAQIPFPLPPLPEQKRIVEKLESMLGKLKDARELILEARDTFEKRRAAILHKAFTGELTKKWREENRDIESVDLLLKRIVDQRNEEAKGKTKKTKGIVFLDSTYNVPNCWKWVRFGPRCYT